MVLKNIIGVTATMLTMMAIYAAVIQTILFLGVK